MPDPELRALGRAIASVRTQRGWTQEEMASAARAQGMKVWRPDVSAIENGTVDTGTSRLVRLAVVLDITMSELWRIKEAIGERERRAEGKRSASGEEG